MRDQTVGSSCGNLHCRLFKAEFCCAQNPTHPSIEEQSLHNATFIHTGQTSMNKEMVQQLIGF